MSPYNRNGEIGTEDLTQAAAIAKLIPHQTRVAILTLLESISMTESYAYIAALAQARINNHFLGFH